MHPLIKSAAEKVIVDQCKELTEQQMQRLYMIFNKPFNLPLPEFVAGLPINKYDSVLDIIERTIKS